MQPILPKIFSVSRPWLLLLLIALLAALAPVQAQPPTFTVNGQNVTANQTVDVCVNTPVSFLNTTSGTFTGTSWKFQNGSPPTSTLALLNVTFAAPNTNRVVLTVNRSGTPDSLVAFVRVNANNINTNFNFSPGSQCSNVPVQFTNSSTGTGLTYAWSFGDPNSGTGNNTSNLMNPVHEFVGTPGSGNQSFTVTLVATDNVGCSSTKTQTLSTKQLPGTQLGGTGLTTYEGRPFFRVCASGTSGAFNFTNLSSTQANNSNYRILWGNGAPEFNVANFVATSQTYNVGIYDLQFIVSGQNGCIDTAIYGVFVGSNPAVGLSNPGNTSICTGSALKFPIEGTTLNPPGTTYKVTFNDGSPTLSFQHPPPADITHTFNTTSCGTSSPGFPNSFSATISAANPCLVSQASVVPIYVSQKPKAAINVAPRDTVCTGLGVVVSDGSGTLNFIDNGNCNSGMRIWSISPATGYSLSGTLGNDFGFTDPTLWQNGSASLSLNFSQPGTYIFKLKVANPVCGSDSITRTICVNPPPVAAFTIDKTAGCAPLTVNTTNTSNQPSCGANTYQWSVTYASFAGCSPGSSGYTLLNGTTLTSAEPAFQFNNPGTYTLWLVTRNSQGVCTSPTVNRTITVREKPNASFTSPATICQNAGFTPVASVSNCGGASAATYDWQFPGGTPASSNAASPGMVLFGTPGSYSLSLSVSNECGTTLFTRPLTVNPTPDVTVPSGDILCRGQQAGPYTFTPNPANAPVNWTNTNTTIGLAGSGTGNINAFIIPVAGATVTSTITVTPIVGACPGTPKSFSITANALPAAPGVSTPLNLCVGDAAGSLTATATAGHTLKWYTTATGGTAGTAPTPNTTAPGTTTWWVSQSNNTTLCEGPRASITVNVNPVPAIATFVSSNPTNCGTANGSITLKGLQPGTSFTVTYTRNGTPVTTTLTANASGDLTIAGLAAAVYDNIRVTAAGCASQPVGPVSLSDPNPPATPTAGSNSPLCSGATLNLTASSSSPGAIVYTWSGPVGFNSTQQNPTIANATTAATGTYSVTARLGNCTSPAATVAVVVNPTPALNAGSNSPVCSGSSINLTASSTTPGAITYAWTGPNNFSSTQQNPTIPNATPADGGNYVVTATLGPCTSAPRTVSTLVRPTPAIANAAPQNPTSCTLANGSITLSGLAPSTAYQLTYLRNGTLVGPTTLTANAGGEVVISNLTPATYSNIVVSLTGCPSAPAGPVTLVAPNPPATPIAANNGPLCVGATLSLKATGSYTGTVSYAWTGPNGYTSTQQNPNIPNANAGASGTYSVTVTVNGCVSAPGTTTAQVSATAAAANAGPDQQLCNAATARLAGNSPGNGTGTWTVLPPSTATVAQPNSPASDLNNLPTGTTRLVWTVSNNVCAASTDTVVINNLPALANAIAPLSSNICNGQSISLGGQLPTGGTGSYSYQWQQSSNNISFNNIAGATNPAITVSPVATTYYRRVVNSGACSAFGDTAVVQVQGAIANNSIAGQQAICINTAAGTLTGSTPAGGGGTFAYSWQQSTDGGITWTTVSGANGRDLTPGILQQTTQYRRGVTTALCSGQQASLSNVVTITVNPNARAVINPNPLTGCAPFRITSTTIGLTPFASLNSTYNWYVNNQPAGSGPNFAGYTIANSGDSALVKVVAISAFGCRNDSASALFRTVVNPAPSFALSDTVGCGPLTVSFANNTPNKANYTFLWNFGNGQTSTAADPGPITFARNPDRGDTIYAVILRATAGCDTLVATRQIRVRAAAKAIISPDKVQGCSPALFTFTNTSRGSGASYTWDFGDGTPLLNSNTAMVQHTYNTGVRRFYNVRLFSTNDCGSDTALVTILVSPNPIRLDVLVNANQLNGCAPHTVQFINNTLGATSFRYNFGDGGPDVLSTRLFDTLTHTYQQPGSYTMRITASNGCTDTTATRAIEVRTSPKAAFAAAPTQVCIGQNISLTNQSTAGAALQWNFGDGTGSGLANPTKSYRAAGTYRITLYASAAFGQGFTCTDSAFATVIVRDTLPGSFSVDSTGSCAPFFVTFKSNLRPAAATVWNFGDGNTATGDSVVHAYTVAGNYLVTMASRDAGGCTYKAQQTITVNGPSGMLQYNAPFACLGQPVTLQVVTGNTARFIYYFGNGDSTVTTNNSVSYNYAAAGVYLPRVVLQSGSCRREVKGADSIRIDRVLAAIQQGSTPNCGSTTYQFTDAGQALFGKGQWLWTFGDGTTSTLRNPIKTYTAPGVYNVRLRLTGLSGCSDSATLPIRVDVQKIPAGSITGDTAACIGQPARFAALVQNTDSVVNLLWSFGNGATSTGNNVSTAYTQGGTYTVTLISRTAFGCADTARRTINVSVSPLVNAGPDLRLCRGQSTQLRATGAASYQWSPTQGLSCANCPNPIAQPTANTTYVVTGINQLGCAATDTLFVEVPQPFRITYSVSDSICLGQSKQLTANGAFAYQWSPATGLNSATIANPVASPTISTTYRVVGYDNSGCFTDTGFVTLGVGRIPTVDLGNGGTVVAGTQVPMSPVFTNGPFARLAWLPATGLSCSDCPSPVATINNNITYTLTVTTPFGCSATDTIGYRVVCTQSEQVYIPNAFSPDNDGVNDVFMVRGKGLARVKYFRVFNRFGQVVFERANFDANDPRYGWDGKINGVPASPDVYVYTAELLCTGGSTYFEKGNVTLVR